MTESRSNSSRVLFLGLAGAVLVVALFLFIRHSRATSPGMKGDLGGRCCPNYCRGPFLSRVQPRQLVPLRLDLLLVGSLLIRFARHSVPCDA